MKDRKTRPVKFIKTTVKEFLGLSSEENEEVERLLQESMEKDSMGTPHKSISVPTEQQEEFDLYLETLLLRLGEAAPINYSEFSRRVVTDSDVLDKSDLSEFLSREARKTAKTKYLVVPFPA